MENVVEKKTTPKKPGDQVNAEYVKLSEMTSKEILALPRYNANLIKQKSRRGQIHYKLVVELDPLLKIERNLLEKEFTLIRLERKLKQELPIQSLVIPIRLLSGKSESSRDWFRYELFVSRNFIVNDFFDSTDVALMHAADIKLKFIPSSERFDDDLISAFNDEDFI